MLSQLQFPVDTTKGFGADAIPAVTSSRSHHVTAGPSRQSPRYYGGVGVGGGGSGGGSSRTRKSVPSRYREASPLKHRPPPTAEYYYSTPAPPRHAVDHPKVYGYEGRESPREIKARPVLLSAAESCGRYVRLDLAGRKLKCLI